MADSYNKKEREKLRRKRKQEKAERKRQRKEEGKKPLEFMYVDDNGNLTATPPDNFKRKEVKLEDIQISTPKMSDLGEEEKVLEGLVKFFNYEKQYGFINKIGSREDYFVHEDNLLEKIKDNDKVLFELASGPRGMVAVNVKLFKPTEQIQKGANLKSPPV